MEQHIVVIRPKADADIRRVFARIRRLISNSSAVNWYSGLVVRLRKLARDPHLWPEADEAAACNQNLRCMLYHRSSHVYRILFTIDGQTVNVLRVRHAAQDALSEGEI